MSNDELLSFLLPEDFELPASWNDFFKIEEGKHKIRLLQWPLMQYEIWKEEWEKRTKEVFEYTKENSKIPWVKLVWNVLIYNYDYKSVQIWSINQKKIMQNLIDINKEVVLSSIDLTIIRKWKGMNDTTYTIIPSWLTTFAIEEVLKEVSERPLIERLKKSSLESDEESSLESDEESIKKEIEARKVSTSDVEEVFA